MPVHKFRIIALLLWGMAPGALAQNLPSSSQLDEIRKTPIRNEIRKDSNTFDPKENKGLFDKFDALKQQLDQDLSEPLQLRREAFELYRAGKYQDAIANFTTLIEQEYQLAESYTFRGFIYAKIRDHALAIQDYNQSIALAPYAPNAYLDRGSSFEALGKYPEAEADFLKSLRLNPDKYSKYSALNNLGNLYLQERVFNKAFRFFNQAIAVDPERFEAIVNRGKVYGIQENCPLAIQDFSKGISIKPDKAILYRFRAYCYLRVDKRELAIKDVVKATSLER